MKGRKGTPSKRGDVLGGWTLDEHLGSGGNGDVWRASGQDQKPHAIKVLKTLTAESYARFKNEIDILGTLGDLAGIVPLVEKYIPDDSSSDTPWFVMPIAIPFSEYSPKKTPTDIVRDFVDLAKTIGELHDRRISHRDIKPANLLYLNERLCLSDFGLVKYPTRAELTPEKRDVGAKFTMAPEMRRHAAAADGMPADVYSFSKSLWIALTGQELGFDGQYNPESILALRNYLSNTYTTTLDQLLSECTETDPACRPSMQLVIERLREWLALIDDFHRRNLIEWNELSQKLFPLAKPVQATWSQVDEICMVLSEIARVPALNHMFYPTGGGNTIARVSRSVEPGMIELRTGGGGADVLKPAKLTFESFGADMRWSYFRLEAAAIEPSGVEGAVDSQSESEALTEIAPGRYASYNCWEASEYKGNPLPPTARPITRFLKGCFVFFSTRSVYNQEPGTYDARHNRMTEDQFRDYIQKNAENSARVHGDN